MDYYVSKPYITNLEKRYILDAIKSGWISSKGKYIELFEENFRKYLGSKYSISCSNGTTALHLCLLALGIGPGDEVIIPSITYISTANVVKYVGATPVFAEIEEDTWNIDPKYVEKIINPRTKAIILVHLYGHPVDFDQFIKIKRKYNIYLIEDAAEAHGAEYKNRKVGTIGDCAAFSFFGNKIITTGEGGMVVTNNKDIANKVILLKSQGMDKKKRYWFPVVGYNYRMTNLQAAIGYAQLQNIERLVEKRLEIANCYKEYLVRYNDLIQLPVQKEYAKNVYWLYSIVFKKTVKKRRDQVIYELERKGIETRPFFYPIYFMPPYKQALKLPITEYISLRGINLPTYYELKNKDIKRISEELIRIISG